MTISSQHLDSLRNESLDHLVTIGDWVRFGASQCERHDCFYGHGNTHALDEARQLIASSLRLHPVDLLQLSAASVLPSERLQLWNNLHKRCIAKLPNAYITGEAWYAGHRFSSDARALIPRSLLINALETLLPEEAVDDLWPSLQELNPQAAILDLCTGGGSLAIAMAYFFDARGFAPTITGSDLSENALSLAKENLKRHQLQSQIKLKQGDLFGGLGKKQKFDLIVCNPPYVNAASMKQLPAEYKHEPEMALASGTDGMDFIERLLVELPSRLLENGHLLLEIGNEIANFEALMTRLSRQNLALDYSTIEVPAGTEMVVLVNCA